MHRFAAIVIALTAWAGLVVQFAATFDQTGSAAETLWILLRFFTVITNLFVAIVMTKVALGRRVSPFIHAGLALAIVFVGLVYAMLLHGLVELSGLALIADYLLHYAVPIAMAVYWPAFAPKIGLRFRDPLLWCVYPLAYLFYVVVRGSVDGRYPYPFIDVAALGYGRIVLNSMLLLVAYLLAGLLLVALGRLLARRRGARGPLGQSSPNG
ncbi:MAG TPA: Pr6Pr family membrane protein [Sphingomicrobium sp.]|nr:Pr6Pr family membrane protein [Sphingomicrobium sp.]